MRGRVDTDYLSNLHIVIGSSGKIMGIVAVFRCVNHRFSEKSYYSKDCHEIA